MQLGKYPTKVEQIDALSNDRTSLWVKRDDLTNEIYGGNKVRKLEYLLREAERRGAKRIITFGAAGSHQVLATVVHGRAAGFEVAAVLTPQPFSEHARDNLRAALKFGLQPYPCPQLPAVPIVFAKALRRKDYVVPPGGSNVTGSMGYADAAAELAVQVEDGCLPEPDIVVVALGSGGTAAGLVAGLLQTRLSCVVSAVRVVHPLLMTKTAALLLARAVTRRQGHREPITKVAQRFQMVRDRLGRGYAYPTSWGEDATEQARRAGLPLESTYTAKAFSHALRAVESRQHQNVLYWHTFSAVDSGPLGKGTELPAELEALWISW